MTGTDIQFDKAFQALTSHAPMRWQRRLFERMMQSDMPKTCDLPTGLGKTSVIPIWLIALASGVSNESIKLPRRLIYIVNRRTVVDQATDMVEQVRNRLLDPNNPSWETHAKVLVQLANELRKLSAGLDDLPLAISTLRGELADNGEWKADPARPAIIVGTIDMIGSKLLFSGYGDGIYHSTHHAGLIGQDSLIIHDEAHLTPAFSDLLRSVAGAQQCTGESRPVQIMELSATARLNNESNDLCLEEEDEREEIVQQRLDAGKHLCLHQVDQKELAAKLADLAYNYEAQPSKVLIYVRLPESAHRIVDALVKKLGRDSERRIALLTGTMRGHERDQLARENSVYQALLNHDQPVERTLYLVSTSAGEVGIDLDADHLVCDLTTVDSMIQRLGRVNRRGGKDRVAKVDVVTQRTEEANAKGSELEFDRAIQVTRTILTRLPVIADGIYDASTRSLRELFKDLDGIQKSTAFSPKPTLAPLTDILLDAWSLTSIRKSLPGRPEVEHYLHGLTNDPPETYVAWRKEMAWLDRAEVDMETLGEWFRGCRIEARERLRDRTDVVKKTLHALLDKHLKKDQDRDFPVILLNERGEVERSYLSKIVGKEFNLAYRTVLLPTEAGGLMTPYGTLDGSVIEPANDVAETGSQMDKNDRRERWLLIETEDGDRWERLLTRVMAPSAPQGLREFQRVTLQAAPEGVEKDMERLHLVLMVGLQQAALEDPEIARTKQTLEQHTAYIEKYAKSIAKVLKLGRELEEAIVTAAWWHDRGKARPVWQRFACNSDPANPLAKSTKYLHGHALGGYRHEFGSLLEAGAALQNHRERDLMLHLIAAHHGWGRPHFELRAGDHTYTTRDNEQASTEVMRRFGRLQQRFGRWGLAWLESLLRCADIAASKQSAEALVPARPEEVQA